LARESCSSAGYIAEGKGIMISVSIVSPGYGTGNYHLHIRDSNSLISNSSNASHPKMDVVPKKSPSCMWTEDDSWLVPFLGR
jgi:hypothetical protein